MTGPFVGIVDYGVGNLRSVSNAIEQVGGVPKVSSDPAVLAACERLILPGVGAFGHGVAELRSRGMDQLVGACAAQGKPVLGICLGMQMLTDSSQEFGEHQGLGLLSGTVRQLTGVSDGVGHPEPSYVLRLPNVDWQKVNARTGATGLGPRLMDGLTAASSFYFIHSFAVNADSPDLVATAEFEGQQFAAIIGRGNVAGTQFHPEKSGKDGLRLLRNFINVPEETI